MPDNLRDRWSLHLGPSRQVLPGVLRRAGNIDIFLHDADHTYRSMVEEYRQAWPSLRAGGLLLSDDATYTGAFLDFAAQVGCRPFMIPDEQGIATVGVLLKPAHES